MAEHIGGEEAKRLTVADEDDERVLIRVTNPHLVPITEITVEVIAGKVCVTWEPV